MPWKTAAASECSKHPKAHSFINPFDNEGLPDMDSNHEYDV
jgi:hypothetical protein